MTSSKEANEINEKYSKINGISARDATVFFGSTVLSEMPICELTKSVGLDEFVYNRSVKNMSVYEAQNYLQSCVLDLKPSKLFIEIGEEDLKEGHFDINDFISKYEWILYSIHSAVHSKIHVISTFGKNSEAVNKRLKQLSVDSGCEFIDVSDEYGCDGFEIKFINRLKYYLRSGNIDFYDAMNARI